MRTLWNQIGFELCNMIPLLHKYCLSNFLSENVEWWIYRKVSKIANNVYIRLSTFKLYLKMKDKVPKE